MGQGVEKRLNERTVGYKKKRPTRENKLIPEEKDTEQGKKLIPDEKKTIMKFNKNTQNLIDLTL